MTALAEVLPHRAKVETKRPVSGNLHLTLTVLVARRNLTCQACPTPIARGALHATDRDGHWFCLDCVERPCLNCGGGPQFRHKTWCGVAPGKRPMTDAELSELLAELGVPDA